jgi:hypothetical protein
VREIEKKVNVSQIILLSQFDTHIPLAEATIREKNNKKLPIKGIVATQLFKEKEQTIVTTKK